MTTHQQYRPDIDGLRAISVIAVMIFHFFPSFLPGGFTAVDLFFVISGFVVTKSILTDLQSGEFSIRGFYARRIRRIVPATLPIYITCFIFGGVFTLTEDFSEVGERALYSIGMIKNFYLMTKSEYFAQSSELNPFTHFWSLSVEEQFYLVWPLLILSSWRWLKNRFWMILTGIFILSLILNLAMIHDEPRITFYLLPTRMWQLVAGSLLCISGDRLRFSNRHQNLISGLTLVIMTLTFAFMESDQYYPGYRALFPVLGAVLFISTPDAFLNRFLSGKWFVTIGLMSYSIYLWHWPLLSFFNTLFPSQMTYFDLSLLFIATILIGWLSYHLVEVPARKLPQERAARYFLTSTVIVSILAAFIAASDGKLILHPELEKSATDLEDFDGEVPFMADFCKNSDIKYCILSDPKKPPTVALIGDSHASHWLPGLKDFYDARNENLVMLVQEQTPPLIDVIANDKKKFSDMTKVFQMVNESPTIHTVVLSAFWAVYASELPIKVGKEFMKRRIKDPTMKESSQEKLFASLLIKTFWSLKQAGKKVIFLQDVPTTPFFGDKSMPRPFFETAFPVCVFDEHVCTYPYENMKNAQINYRRVVQAIHGIFPDVLILDPVPLFCDEGSGLCLSHPSGKVVYSDEHHISIGGSRFLIPRFFKPEP